MAVGFFGKLLHGGSKVSKTIDKVKPFVPETKAEISARDLRRARAKRKTSEVNLDNTLFRIEQESKKLKDMKAKGGRVGLKFGSKKSNIQKINKTFSSKTNKKLSPKQMKIAKLAGNKNKIDEQDLAKLRGRG